MDAGLFDVLHDPADDHVGPVGQRIHVHFGGFFQELIDQHGSRRTHQRRLRHIFLHGVDVVRDHHRTPAQHVTGTHQHRHTNLARHARRFFRNQRGGIARLRDSQLFQQPPEPAPIFRKIDRFRRRANNRHAVALQFQRQIQRRLPAKLHDHALRLLALHDRQHVFQRQRLEVQPVRRVVVGRHRLRIAIHHDRFVAVFAQRKRRVAAAIVELNSLRDAIRPAAQNHDLRPRLRDPIRPLPRTSNTCTA